jgi:hypothetical protein
VCSDRKSLFSYNIYIVVLEIFFVRCLVPIVNYDTGNILLLIGCDLTLFYRITVHEFVCCIASFL